MNSSNTYPDGTWIILGVVFAILGYQSLWRKWKAKTFFSKQWDNGQDNLSIDYIKNTLVELSENTNFGFGIIKQTTVVIENKKLPIIFGYVDHPQAKPYGPGRGHTKAFFTFSNFENITWLLEKYPKIFKEVCNNESYKVCWIKNIQLLENEIKTNKIS